MYHLENGMFIEDEIDNFDYPEIKILNCSNHILNEEQIEDLEKCFPENTVKIVELPEDLKKKWSQLTPWDYKSTVKDILDMCDEEKINYIHLAGFMPAVLDMVSHGGYKHFMYSYTERVSEEKEVDGKIIKTAVFKHQGWFEY